ncbi:NADP-dependent isocitrate dehydrogenase [Terriglobus saanensis]|uniref:Isocitrate dehydrogenase [NADP] n=1 Tax=Terriglobus saanensis (strain ATCC BAA-1853 / DSM 23119 / SP1PR4) TaxID=401053 RepID=E8V8D0_TERSS|nr:NADP-dependent isocitrate dehydrogenase [Terriglobus saanensis]ADV81833.1 isocitrate dehydrogenase, NADP-dependent [Terriglobus saanensis SP1PR4]
MQTSYNGIALPPNGQVIDYKDGKFIVPSHPIVPFIEGDGSGRDIWKNAQMVFDAAVEKAYKGERKVEWYEVLAGEKAFREKGDWLPQDTVQAAIDFRISIKGPLTTPIGGGIRSLNVTLRQTLDLYQCIRPVKHYPGVPSPMLKPDEVDIVLFRENTEDIYAGIEFKEGTPEAKKFMDFVNTELLAGTKKRLRDDAGFGIKPISIRGSKRLVRAAIQYAIDHNRKVMTIVHKGNIQKFTEGAFLDWGYQVAKEEFRAQIITERESWILGALDKNASITPEEIAAIVEPGITFAAPAFGEKIVAEVKDVLAKIGETHGNGKWKSMVLVNDRIADATFQDLLLKPAEYSVLATTNLNGDYLSDAAAAQVGGLGIAPGMNLGDGFAVFEATHGTAPRLADQDVVNPGSVILSGVLLLELLGWKEAADMIEKAMEETIKQKFVTIDFHKGMAGSALASTSAFSKRIVQNMK